MTAISVDRCRRSVSHVFAAQKGHQRAWTWVSLCHRHGNHAGDLRETPSPWQQRSCFSCIVSKIVLRLTGRNVDLMLYVVVSKPREGSFNNKWHFEVVNIHIIYDNSLIYLIHFINKRFLRPVASNPSRLGRNIGAINRKLPLNFHGYQSS